MFRMKKEKKELESEIAKGLAKGLATLPQEEIGKVIARLPEKVNGGFLFRKEVIWHLKMLN